MGSVKTGELRRRVGIREKWTDVMDKTIFIWYVQIERVRKEFLCKNIC